MRRRFEYTLDPITGENIFNLKYMILNEGQQIFSYIYHDVHTLIMT